MKSNNIVYTRAGVIECDLAVMQEVLQPYPAPDFRFLKDASFEPGSAQYDAVSKAAEAVRDIYNAGIRRVPYYDRQPEVFFDACAQTQYGTYAVIEQSHGDEKEASIAMSVIRRAGLCDSRIRPIYADARAAIIASAVEAAINIRYLFAKQDSLAFA